MRLWTEGPDVGGDRGSRGAQVAAPLIVSALVGLATLAACGRHRSETNALPHAEWLLRVETRHWSDVRVSVVHDGLTTAPRPRPAWPWRVCTATTDSPTTPLAALSTRPSAALAPRPRYVPRPTVPESVSSAVMRTPVRGSGVGSGT